MILRQNQGIYQRRCATITNHCFLNPKSLYPNVVDYELCWVKQLKFKISKVQTISLQRSLHISFTIKHDQFSQVKIFISQRTGTLLKGVYEDYTWGYHRKPLDHSFFEFQFHLVPLIPYSAIAKKILVRTLIFHSFTPVENKPSKQPRADTGGGGGTFAPP